MTIEYALESTDKGTYLSVMNDGSVEEINIKVKVTVSDEGEYTLLGEGSDYTSFNFEYKNNPINACIHSLVEGDTQKLVLTKNLCADELHFAKELRSAMNKAKQKDNKRRYYSQGEGYGIEEHHRDFENGWDMFTSDLIEIYEKAYPSDYTSWLTFLRQGPQLAEAMSNVVLEKWTGYTPDSMVDSLGYSQGYIEALSAFMRILDKYKSL